MKKYSNTELGKAMKVIDCFIGRKLSESAKIRSQAGKSKFYSCLSQKGFTVHINQFTNKVVKISYDPYAWDCLDLHKSSKKVS